MKIKECYISKNGITCLTDINSLFSVLDLKKIDVNKKIDKIFSKNNFLLYLFLRSMEFVMRDFFQNKFYLLNINNFNCSHNIITSIIYS